MPKKPTVVSESTKRLAKQSAKKITKKHSAKKAIGWVAPKSNKKTAKPTKNTCEICGKSWSIEAQLCRSCQRRLVNICKNGKTSVDKLLVSLMKTRSIEKRTRIQ